MKYWFLVFFSIMLFGCYLFSLFKRKQPKIELFYLSLSTPEINYVNLIEGYFRVKKNREYADVSCLIYPYNSAVGGNLLEGESGGFVYEYPSGIDLAWISYNEKKVYTLNVDFPEEMIQHMKEMKEDDGLINKRGNKDTYNKLKTEIYPHGQVRFSLVASTTFRSMDWCFQANETHEFDQFILDKRSLGSMETIWNAAFMVGSESKSKHPTDKKYWIDYTVDSNLPSADEWNSFHKRYDYFVEFEFTSPDDSLDFWAPWFSNGEHFALKIGVNDMIVWDKKSVLTEMSLWWKDSNYQYTSKFYYDVDELLHIFNKAFVDHPGEKGKLLFKIEKEGKKYDEINISLRVGESLYSINKTEIHVNRVSLTSRIDESDLVYKNYEGDFENFFIGY